jgi:hypothetical protein
VCDSHHIRPWLKGGPTELGNLVLLAGVTGLFITVSGKSNWSTTVRPGSPHYPMRIQDENRDGTTYTV